MKISIFWLLCLALLASCGNSNEGGMKTGPSEKAKNLNSSAKQKMFLN